MIGTHTHVQTADERILSGGTAYLTDAGMCGSFDSVLGVRKELARSEEHTSELQSHSFIKDDNLIKMLICCEKSGHFQKK